MPASVAGARAPPPRPRTTSARKPLPRPVASVSTLVAPVAVEADGRAAQEHATASGRGRPWCGRASVGALRAALEDPPLLLVAPPLVADALAGQVDHGVDAGEAGGVDGAGGRVPADLVGAGRRPADERPHLVAVGPAARARAAVPMRPLAPVTAMSMRRLSTLPCSMAPTARPLRTRLEATAVGMAESVLTLLAARAEAAVRAAFGAGVEVPDPLVLPSRDPRHGDYSSPVAMALAKTLRQAPLALAEQLAAALDVADLCEPPEVSAPGFVNLRLRPDWLAGRPRRRPGATTGRRRPAADGSSSTTRRPTWPSTCTSATCARRSSATPGQRLRARSATASSGSTTSATGAPSSACSLAHLEDAPVRRRRPGDRRRRGLLPGGQRPLTRTTRTSTSGPGGRVVDLQSGEPSARADLDGAGRASRREFNQPVYDLLGIHGLEERGESFYEPMLAGGRGRARGQGPAGRGPGRASACSSPGFTNKEGDPLPLIVAEPATAATATPPPTWPPSATGSGELGADRVLYVVDAGQCQHLADGVRRGPHGRLGPRRRRGRARAPSASCSARTASACGPGRATTSGSIDLLREAVDRARPFVVARAEERGEAPPDDVDRGRPGHRRRRGEVRRPQPEPAEQLRVLLRPDAQPQGQHRARTSSTPTPACARSCGRAGDGPSGRGRARASRPGDRAGQAAGRRCPTCSTGWSPTTRPTTSAPTSSRWPRPTTRFYEHCPVLRAEEPARSSRLACAP